MSDFQRFACPCTEKLHTDLGEIISDEGADVFPNTCDDDARMTEAIEYPSRLNPKNFRLTLIIVPCTKHPDVKVRYVMCAVNLEQAIATRKESLRKAASDPSELAIHMSSLARFRHLFFLVTSRNEFLVYATSGLDRCLRTLQMDDYHKAMYMAEMGVYHHSSFHHFGAGLESISDMINAIQCLKDAIELLSEDSPTALASYLDRELASLLLCQFRSDPHKDVLENAAIARLRERVDLPMDLRCRSSSLEILTDILMSRFESNQSAIDLDDAIAYHEKVLRLLPDIEMDDDGTIKCTDTKSETTLDALTSYSTFLCTRFGQTGALKSTDLETAMYWAEFVTKRIPKDCSQRTKRRRENCLVNCLMQRYQADGPIEDIYRAYRTTTPHRV
ncbi:hypothetical protein EWM64_g4458 [Hericium alpestre]|uniref:Uncharacterized protein n=1 Tax=Hericium alpestre TaxID=135208 RepID=A0A4Z0A046_9AGAM|nr:hypothetical protein EWM64_g4458 [Hericium alpestre]